MFWSKKSEVDTKDDDGNHLPKKENITENGDIQSIINDVMDEDKRRTDSLREKANSRAEALELSKFPVCIFIYLCFESLLNKKY